MLTEADHTNWKANNLVEINKRLEALRAAETIEHVMPGEHQGVFVRKIEKTIEMYCYDNDTQKMSGIMSRIHLDNPLNLIGPYSQAMFLSAFWQIKKPQSVYIAGFGGGRLAMAFDHYFQGMKIDGTDIDANILAASQVFFGLDGNRLKGIHIADSRQDLKDRKQVYDVFLLDVFSGGGEHVNHLATVEFFELCKSRMSKDAVIVANLIEMDPLLENKKAAMQAVFKHSYVWKHDGAQVVFASNADLNHSEFYTRVQKFQNDQNLDFDMMDKANALKPLPSHKSAKPLTDSNL